MYKQVCGFSSKTVKPNQLEQRIECSRKSTLIVFNKNECFSEIDGLALLEKRTSMKSKYLTFDDTLLQSPRHLNSSSTQQSFAVKLVYSLLLFHNFCVNLAGNQNLHTIM